LSSLKGHLLTKIRLCGVEEEIVRHFVNAKKVMALKRYMALTLLVLALHPCSSSRGGEEEEKEKDPILNYAAIEEPFRMRKVNLVWEKARIKMTHAKLKVLFYELKLHDKEELALKKLKAEYGDKDGLREAEVRKRFNGILNHYGLGKSNNEAEAKEDEVKKKAADNLRLFKDKKLDRLWEKARQSEEMREEDLKILKMEFEHYQEKMDQYNRLMEIKGRDPLDQNRRKNTIDDLDEFEAAFEADEETVKHVNALEGDEMKKDLKRHYAKIKRMATEGAQNAPAFHEPKVAGLWKLAQEAEFSQKELDSLRTELKHYEHRLQKLHLMKAEKSLMEDEGRDVIKNGSNDVTGNGAQHGFDLRLKQMDKKVKKQADTVKDIHVELERKIVARHTEL